MGRRDVIGPVDVFIEIDIDLDKKTDRADARLRLSPSSFFHVLLSLIFSSGSMTRQPKHRHRLRELLRLVAQTFCRCGRFLHQRGVLLRHLVQL